MADFATLISKFFIYFLLRLLKNANVTEVLSLNAFLADQSDDGLDTIYYDTNKFTMCF